MAREENARRRIHKSYSDGKTNMLDIHTITFQPRGHRSNDDRLVVDRWELFGHRYLFLAVFDGHSGTAAVEHTSQNLPTALRRKLRRYLDNIGGRLDRGNIAQFEKQVTAIIKYEIEKFDRAIGDELQRICPRPWELSEEEARKLIEDNMDIVERAFSGTTVAFVLANLQERFMWAAGLGDSSVGISIVDENGKRRGQRLCDFHSFNQPQEYFRATMAHSYAEQPLFDRDNHVLGWLGVARAIGDFAVKLPASYTAHLFQFLPNLSNNPPLSAYVPRIQTPPYISSEPSVRFTDLQPYWDTGSTIFLFTDGVDNLVDGFFTFTPLKHSGVDPIQVVAGLLADEADPEVEKALGHAVFPKWSMEKENRALDVLGNLLGGRDVEKLELVTALDRMDTDEEWSLHIDDTSIILWPLSITS